jgi:sodium/bile acid cotransporter 7
MFMSTSATWSFGAPNAGPGGTGEIYRPVIQQLGLTVFVPLFVGEVVQWLIPKFVKRWRLKLKLAKFASLCLLGVIWSTFCNAFWSGAFEELSTPTVRRAFNVQVAARKE